MMKQMRENTKVIIWIVVVAFMITIFAVWGLDLSTGGNPAQQNLLGRVNGVAITPQTYQSVYNQLAGQFRTAAPDGRLSAAQQEALRDHAWERVVESILTDEEIERLGIRVLDEEILAYLRTSPPPEVQGYFLDDAGNFDFAAYQAALNNPSADWTAVEALARQRIPLFKLNQYLTSKVHVGIAETRARWEEENLRMVAQYVSFPVSSIDVGEYAPSQEDIAAYYAAHEDDFSLGARAVVTYAQIPITPTALDREDVAFTIQSVHDNIMDGAEFDGEARTYSEGTTAALGGHTGFLRTSEFDPALADIVPALSVGDVSSPVTTDNGAYIVKLLETKEEDGETTYRIQEIFLSLSAGAQTLDSLITVAQELQRTAAESDLAGAAGNMGIAVATTSPFSEDGAIDGLGLVPTVARFAFANPAGALSNVLNDDASYYVARVDERIDPTVRPLDEVRNTIIERIHEERRKDGARRNATAFRRSLASNIEGRLMADVAEQYNYNVIVSDTFTVTNAVGDIPPSSAFQRAALMLEVGPQSPPIETGDTFYVLEVLYRSPFDSETFAAAAPALRDRLLAEKAQSYIEYWYSSLREKSNIEDFRGTL